MALPGGKVTFPNGRGQTLAGRLDLPAGEPVAFALFAHCFTCSSDSLAASRISRALGREGFAVLRFDFTGLGGSEGDFANTNFSSNVADLVAAAIWLREEHQAPRLLAGHSLGGAAVLLAAHEIPECRAVATLAAPSEPSHLLALLGDDAAAVEREGSAPVEIAGRTFQVERQLLRDLAEERVLARVRELRRALLVCHSPHDRVVGIEHARRIFEAALHPKSFLSLDGADHLLTRREDAEYVARTLAAWASRYVATPAARAEAIALAEGEVLVEGGGQGFAQTIHAGGHVLAADEPESAGGTGTGPSPYDLLLASLGACTSMTLGMYARRKAWPLERVAVRLTHAKVHAEDCENCDERDGMLDRIEREVQVEGALDAAQRERLLEIANKCPVHRTLTGKIDVRTKLAE